MKNKIYIFIAFALLFGGCQDFNTDDTPFGRKAELMVSLDIPEPTIAKTRAGIQDELSSLCALVFNKNGLYLSKHDGVYVSGTAHSANYRFGSIAATKEGELLILHFVANYDWTSFSDAANVGKSEAEVMNKLTVGDGKVAYWQRVELPSGLDTTRGTVINLKDNVSLLRNMAKISVENLTNGSAANKYLTSVTFAVGDFLDRGTVAPYSTSSYKFVKGAITEALDGNLVSITGESDFVDVEDASTGSISGFKYIYERKNSTARNQTYIILKGYFQNVQSGANNTTPSYYKIDLDNDEATVLLDIERNYHYIIRINDVATEGYRTLKEAIDNPASNNINAAVQVAEYTSVSDGTNILQIEKAVFSFVSSGQDFQIKCSYYDGGLGSINNDKIVVSLEQNPSTPVIKNGAFTYSDGVISATTADVPTNNDIYQATFHVSDGKHLSRKITIRMRKPMNFLNVSVTPNNGTDLTYSKVANLVGQPVTITFSFPPDISPAIFPLPVYIYTKKLSPDPTKEGIQPLSVDPRPNSTFRYVYMAPYLGNDANDVPMPHTVYLVSATPSSNEEIILGSDYFNDVPITLRSEQMPALSNVKFNPNPVLGLKDQLSVLTFDIPTVSDNRLPYRIRIHTDYLEYVSQSTGVACEWDEVMGVYYYTTNTTGNQSITFKTTQIGNAEYVRIDGDRFASITVRRTNAMGEFKDVSTKISSTSAGTPVDILFSFDATGAAYANSGSMFVHFKTNLLIPAANSGIEATENTNEYRMHVLSAAVQTARFVLKQQVDDFQRETVTMSSPIFLKPYLATYEAPGSYKFGSDLRGYENRPVLVSNYTGGAISLDERTSGQTNELHFSIPSGSVSEANPLWVHLKSTHVIQLDPSSPKGIAEVVALSGPTTDIWVRITSPGNKTLYIRSVTDNSPAVLTMTSVSDKNVQTPDGRFEVLSNIQDKTWTR